LGDDTVKKCCLPPLPPALFRELALGGKGGAIGARFSPIWVPLETPYYGIWSLTPSPAIIEDDGIQCLGKSRLDHGGLSHVDLGRDQRMDRHRFLAMVDAGQRLNFPPRSIFGVACGKFLSHFERDDDLSNYARQDTQPARQDGMEMNRRTRVNDCHERPSCRVRAMFKSFSRSSSPVCRAETPHRPSSYRK
jgi:hypothetical protein